LTICETLPEPPALKALLREVNASPFIGYLSARDLAARAEQGAIRFYHRADGPLLGFGAWQVIDDAWCEIGPFFVTQQARGTGVGRAMFDAIVGQQRTAGYHLYVVTKNDVVRYIFRAYGFAEIAGSALPRVLRGRMLATLSLRRVLAHVLKYRPGDRITHFVDYRTPVTAL
jgi:GNAT superfamily N-acetyltransferase